ncbi:hypothetical protein LguiB_009125 [Lonicera macranthoides]
MARPRGNCGPNEHRGVGKMTRVPLKKGDRLLGKSMHGRVIEIGLIKKGDSFYSVSINAFENLTNYHVVQEMNPTLNPTNLKIGDEVVFPLSCKCPSKSHLQNGINYLLTYVWQPGDDILLVSDMFNTSPSSITNENSFRNFTAAVCLPVLVPVSQLPVLSQPTPLSPSRSKPKKGRFIFIVLGTVGAFLIVISSILFIYIQFFNKKKITLVRNASSLDFVDLIQTNKDTNEGAFRSKSIQNKLLPGVSGYLGKPIMYEKKVIMEATMNLSEHYRIGGSVYKAMINGQILAMKKFKDATEELKILQRVNHANLVKLMGISSDNDGNCFLVYEFAENGSLDKWLFPKLSSCSSSMAFLNWTQRLQVALDVANGLHYMHEHTQPSIAHRDIRTTNILLDSRFKAKIANFSTARPSMSSSMLKVDVFSFGVVLLELLSGRKAMETRENGEIGMLWKEIQGILEQGEKRGDAKEVDGPKTRGILPWPSMGEMVFNLSVLTQSSPEMYDGSWTSVLEAEEAVRILSPVIPR